MSLLFLCSEHHPTWQAPPYSSRLKDFVLNFFNLCSKADKQLTLICCDKIGPQSYRNKGKSIPRRCDLFFELQGLSGISSGQNRSDFPGRHSISHIKEKIGVPSRVRLGCGPRLLFLVACRESLPSFFWAQQTQPGARGW